MHEFTYSYLIFKFNSADITILKIKLDFVLLKKT